MTESIVLKIVTDSTDAVTGIVDVKKATEALRAELKKLDEQLKNLGRFDAKEKTDLQVKYNGITKAITELEKPLDDATKKQNALNESQKKGATGTAALGKSFTDFAKKAGLVAAALGILTKIGQALIQTFKDTAAGMGLVVRAQTIWKQQIYDLVQGNIKQGASIKELNDWSTKKIALQLRENDVLVTNSKLQNEYDKLLVESAKAGKSAAEKLELLNKAEEKKNLIDENNINMMKQNLELLKEDIKRRPELLSLKQQEAQLTAAINIAEGQKSLRLQQKQTAAWDQMWSDYKAWIEKMTDAQDEFQSLSLKLLEDYEKTQIDLLEGNDKIAAQRDYDLKQLDEFRKQMQRLGKLTAEQEKQFAILGAGIWMAFYEGLTKEAQKALPQKDIDAISKVLLPELAGIQTPVVNTAKNIADKLAGYKANEEFSFWNLLGLSPDDEDDKEMISAIEKSANAIDDILNEALDNRVQIAERERELLDIKIAETQRTIELEQGLYEEGYANNLDAQKAYLVQLKAEREKALQEEEKAIKRQQLYEKITQTGSLLTSVAQILAHATKMGLAGLALAPFAIATLWAIWGKAKSSTKLAEGGSGSDTGIITGKRHSQGGERFLDHVEVERGEQWGVLSRPASEKYGKVFHDMVSSFNKDQMPNFMPVTNQVRVENSGPNSRLDKVITEQKKLNQSLLKQSQIGFIGNKKVIRNGNKVRIVG